MIVFDETESSGLEAVMAYLRRHPVIRLKTLRKTKKNSWQLVSWSIFK
jgi:hypothetical protein